jgi:hypothetical protein
MPLLMTSFPWRQTYVTGKRGAAQGSLVLAAFVLNMALMDSCHYKLGGGMFLACSSFLYGMYGVEGHVHWMWFQHELPHLVTQSSGLTSLAGLGTS